eukprot:2358853-Alexandrium_andersonii.AAC.1
MPAQPRLAPDWRLRRMPEAPIKEARGGGRPSGGPRGCAGAGRYRPCECPPRSSLGGTRPQVSWLAPPASQIPLVRERGGSGGRQPRRERRRPQEAAGNTPTAH